MKFNRYIVFARLLPVILTSTPFFVLYYFLLRTTIGDFISELVRFQWISDVGFTLAVIFLLMQIGRFISKELFEKRMFSGGLNFPTTNYLLHSDPQFSADYTKKIHDKIYGDFQIFIPSFEEESVYELDSRKKIVEAMSLIRVRVGKGNLVNQHNLEYGFIRNLMGGAIVAFLMSVANIIVFEWISFNQTALVVSCFAAFIYLCLLISGKWLINSFASDYAKILIQEYMAK
jgi:hypothetical protein